MAEGDKLQRSVMNPDKLKTVHNEIAKNNQKSPDKLIRSVHFRPDNRKKLLVKEHSGNNPSQRTGNGKYAFKTLKSLSEDISETKQSVDKSTNFTNDQNKNKPLKRSDNLLDRSTPHVSHAQLAVKVQGNEDTSTENSSDFLNDPEPANNESSGNRNTLLLCASGAVAAVGIAGYLKFKN